MFRSLFIYLSKAEWARRIVTKWSFAWRAASRFIAGEKLEDAIRVIKTLNAKGINATLDHLGEHTSNPEESRQATRDILKAIDAIEESGVRANVSIKLTQIGLQLDEKLCEENLREILTHAKQRGNFVRVDMEDSPWTEKTLDYVPPDVGSRVDQHGHGHPGLSLSQRRRCQVCGWERAERCACAKALIKNRRRSLSRR